VGVKTLEMGDLRGMIHWDWIFTVIVTGLLWMVIIFTVVGLSSLVLWMWKHFKHWLWVITK
jgi:hypothetical protein